MSSYYHYNAHQHPASTNGPSSSSHNHHGGRSPSVNAFRQKFEAGRSFDLDDDMEFCPALLTESDLVSIHSSSSDRSSLSSGSPESSPTQQPQQVTPTFSLNSASNPYIPSGYQNQSSNLKLHQPSATRIRAIPIVNPTTGISMTSPPPSVSPARMQQGIGRRW